ncbi:MAG: MerR family transcriptional regulator [Clostridium sp.]
MEYTVQKLGMLTGISTRTLRYYDEIEILKPARINSSGYRIYGENEVDRLQQILFYKELGVSLNDIKNIIDDPLFNGADALESHRKNLLEKRAQLDLLIENVSKTIESKNGVINMSNKDKFKGFKEKIVSDNEKKYGKEIRSKYGDEAINKSNEKIRGMSEETYNEVTKLEIEIRETLALAFETKDPAGELAQKAVELHKKWISHYWGTYSKEAHAGLGQMYVDDERFTAYYDKENKGTAKFLRDAILIYTK